MNKPFRANLLSSRVSLINARRKFWSKVTRRTSIDDAVKLARKYGLQFDFHITPKDVEK